MISDEMARIPSLEEGKQFKFPGMFESVMQVDKLALEFTAKEWIPRGVSYILDEGRCLASVWLSFVDTAVGDNKN